MGFDPATIAIISTVASAASTGIGVMGAIQQGHAASASANYNAAVAANNAELAKRSASMTAAEGEKNAEISQQKTRATVGAMKAAQAANGIDVNTGSAVDVRSSAAELGELDAITIRSNAARHAYSYETQAASDTGQSELDKSQAEGASTAGSINAASTLLGGLGTAGSNYSKFRMNDTMLP